LLTFYVYNILCMYILELVGIFLSSAAYATSYLNYLKDAYWLQTFHPSNPEGSPEHISFIIYTFFMIWLLSSNFSIKGT